MKDTENETEGLETDAVDLRMMERKTERGWWDEGVH